MSAAMKLIPTVSLGSEHQRNASAFILLICAVKVIRIHIREEMRGPWWAELFSVTESDYVAIHIQSLSARG